MMRFKKHNRGFTAFFAVLVSSLALSIGLSIYDLLLRELQLSQTSKESQFAIFAADVGAECALYWDNKYSLPSQPSAFGTSTGSSWGVSPLNCNSQDITVKGPPAVDLSQFASPGHPEYNCASSNAWCVASSAASATTTFSLSFAQGYCATIVITKSGNPSQTAITSHGYNNCLTNSVIRVERTLQVSY